MIIHFNPCRMDKEISLTVDGDVLSITVGNAVETLDFSPLLDGAELPASATGSEWIQGLVKRIGSELHVSVLLPHGPDASESARFPQPVTVANGDVELPK